MRARDPERLASRPGPEQSRRVSATPRRAAISSSPAVGSSARISTALGDAFLRTDDVQAPVDAVGAVDVGKPRRPEHRGVPFGAAVPIAVRGRVL